MAKMKKMPAFTADKSNMAKNTSKKASKPMAFGKGMPGTKPMKGCDCGSHRGK